MALARVCDDGELGRAAGGFVGCTVFSVVVGGTLAARTTWRRVESLDASVVPARVAAPFTVDVVFATASDATDVVVDATCCTVDLGVTVGATVVVACCAAVVVSVTADWAGAVGAG